MSVRSASARGSWSRSGTTVQTSIAMPSSVRAWADRTESRCRASTPARVAKRPVRSGAATVTVQVIASSGSATTASWPARTSSAWVGGQGWRWCWRRTVQVLRGPAYQVVHESRLPVAPRAPARSPARPHGSAPRSRSSTSVVPSTSATAVDRRGVVEVAPGRGLDQQQVVAHEQRDRRDVLRRRARAGSRPSSASGTPASLWSPGAPLPMSCSSAATSSRSGRLTSRTRGAACTAASTRCRSTVKRCTALRCGRWRTAAHSGSSRSTQPGLVERLPHLRRAVARRRAGRRRGRARVLRPRLGQRGRVRGQPVDRARRERQAGPRGAGRQRAAPAAGRTWGRPAR